MKDTPENTIIEYLGEKYDKVLDLSSHVYECSIHFFNFNKRFLLNYWKEVNVEVRSYFQNKINTNKKEI